MASETLKKKLIFFSAFNYFFVIFLFLAIIYSQPTKKKQRLLPRPVTGLGRNESTAGEELREQRTDTWRKEQARKLRDPPTTLYIHPGTTTRWSNQGQSKVGSVRRLVVLVPFHTTNSTQCFHPPEKKNKSECEKGFGDRPFHILFATARASNRILARALIACSSASNTSTRPTVCVLCTKYVFVYEYINTCILDYSTYT